MIGFGLLTCRWSVKSRRFITDDLDFCASEVNGESKIDNYKMI